jgi:hypothetical protein
MVHLLPAIKYPDINMAHINSPHNLSNVLEGENEKVEYMTRNKQDVPSVHSGGSIQPEVGVAPAAHIGLQDV